MFTLSFFFSNLSPIKWSRAYDGVECEWHSLSVASNATLFSCIVNSIGNRWYDELVYFRVQANKLHNCSLPPYHQKCYRRHQSRFMVFGWLVGMWLWWWRLNKISITLGYRGDWSEKKEHMYFYYWIKRPLSWVNKPITQRQSLVHLSTPPVRLIPYLQHFSEKGHHRRWCDRGRHRVWRMVDG